MTEGFWPTGGDGEKNGAAEKRVSSAPDSRTGGSDEDNTLLAFKDEDEDEDEDDARAREGEGWGEGFSDGFGDAPMYSPKGGFSEGFGESL